ncbi:MAG TPA: PIN domain-containing protein [Candidatus Nanopelagicales bacterium]|nr:PIN domain-containing protein [Candidatus Nanopelagicales bacterium]
MSLLDTSVAVALLVSDHSAHERTIAQLPQGSLGLSGHAVFETFSVITRLPNHRVSPAMAHTLISENFPRSIAYRATLEDLDEISRASLAGGQVYDALVALAARSVDRTLLTRDERAMPTYLAMGVDVVLLS